MRFPGRRHFGSIQFKSAIWKNEEWHVLRLECEKLETAVGGEHFQNVQIFLRNMPIMCNPGLVFLLKRAPLGRCVEDLS